MCPARSSRSRQAVTAPEVRPSRSRSRTRRHRLGGVQDRAERLHIGGVQALPGGEGVRQPVDLAVHAAQLHGERVEVRPAARRAARSARLLISPGHGASLVRAPTAPGPPPPHPRARDARKRGRRETVGPGAGPVVRTAVRTRPFHQVTEVRERS